jgi:hypothetical protein
MLDVFRGHVGHSWANLVEATKKPIQRMSFSYSPNGIRTLFFGSDDLGCIRKSRCLVGFCNSLSRATRASFRLLGSQLGSQAAYLQRSGCRENHLARQRQAVMAGATRSSPRATAVGLRRRVSCYTVK